jgi:NTE family protein
MAPHCGNFRNVRRCDECCSTCGRMDEGRSREHAQGSSCLLAAHLARSGVQPAAASLFDRIAGRWTLDGSPAYVAMDIMSRLLSPYDLNPLSLNPLRDALADSIDFEALSRSSIKLFITATKVRTGRGRIFRNGEITADVLLASACLPMMFRAVEIDGEAYWDGGYAGNPTITPLVRESEAHDTILVQINPTERANTPRSAAEIIDRLNEISFNSPLARSSA